MIVVTLPTYNEAGNIVALTEELLALRPDVHVLVMDDNSPDGTWRLVGELAAKNPRVRLLHRTERKGRGHAGKAGFVEALRWCEGDKNAWIVEMDADFSHHPRHIPEMLALGERTGADVVVGSRLVKGGGEAGRSLVRTLITWAANTYIRILLSLPVRDATSGYRAFRASALRKLNWDAIRAPGPAIVQEVSLACRKTGARFAESPIQFEPRRAGQSTFSATIALAGLRAVWRLRRGKPLGD